MYRVAHMSAYLLRVTLVTAAAILPICVLALVETTNKAEATSLPENGKIAFKSNRSSEIGHMENYEIYTAEPDGSNLSRLTNSTQWEERPIWSPDGTKLTFHEAGGDLGIPIMSADGSNLRYIPTDPNITGSLNFFPTWSADGTKLAFDSQDSPDAPSDIYTMDLDGSNQTNLTKTPKYGESHADFSPDGSRMCLSFGGNLESKLASGMYLMDADGSDLTLLIEGNADECNWSPDGTKIAFSYFGLSGDTSDEGFSDGEVAVINTDGSGLINLTSNQAYDGDPGWSPDGTKIAFESNRDDDYDIYTMDADGSDVAKVTKDSTTDSAVSQVHDNDPDWQPLPGTAPPKDADGSDAAQVKKKPGGEDVIRNRPKRTVIVKPGDSLWSISEERLGPEASPQQVYEHTLLMYALNRDRIGPDPNLIFWRQRLLLPPLGER